MREYTTRLDALDKKTQKQDEEKEKEKSAANDFVDLKGPSKRELGVMCVTAKMCISR